MFAGRFWVLRHHVLVFIFAEHAIWSGDHFISKFGDFYHIDVAFLLGEKVGIYRWSAVIAGLSGVVIITNPFSGAMTAAVLYGVGAALAGAVLSILLRRLGKKDSPISVACWYNASGFVALSVIVLIVPSQFHAVSQPVLHDLIFLGVIGAGMQIVLTSPIAILMLLWWHQCATCKCRCLALWGM